MRASAIARELLPLGTRELQGRLDAGHPVSPEEIAGFRYRGISLGLPHLVERLTWKTFVKAFVAEGGEVRGWNERLEQTGLDGPIVNRERRGEPVCFGHFGVLPGEGGRALIHYGQGGNAPWDPVGLVRDPLVALRKGDPTVLLGLSVVCLGPLRLRTPSWFVLERADPVRHVASPPWSPRRPRQLASGAVPASEVAPGG